MFWVGKKKNYSLLASMGKSVLTIFFLFAEQRRRFERCFYVNPRIKEELGNIDFFEQARRHDESLGFVRFISGGTFPEITSDEGDDLVRFDSKLARFSINGRKLKIY